MQDVISEPAITPRSWQKRRAAAPAAGLRNGLLAAGLALLVLALTVPALQPLWQPGLQQTDDGMHHLSRLFGLDLAIRAGHPGTRWLAEEGFGYGFPVLNFYGPLSYYVGLVWHWLGLGYVTSLEWTLAAGLVLAGLAMFLFARRLLGNWGGALAAIAYTWAPYHLSDAWTRGALAELWAFFWFPLLMLALWDIARARGRAMLPPVIWGGAALGGLVLTHNLSLLLAAPLLICWGVGVLLVEARTLRDQLWGFGAYLVLVSVGMLLSAVFWLPVLFESSYIYASHVPVDFEGWRQQLISPGLLVSSWWVQRYTVLQGLKAMHPLGQAQVVLAALGFLVGLARWRSLEPVARLGLVLAFGLTVFALFMQTPPSAALWRGIPGLMLLQFPYRWQTVTTLTLALLTGYLATPLAGPRRTSEDGAPRSAAMWLPVLNAGLIVLAAVALITSALPGVEWIRGTYPASRQFADDATVNYRTMASYDYGRGLWLREFGSDWMFEYMPVWVQVPRDQFFLPASPTLGPEPPLDVQLQPGRQDSLERHFTVQSAQPWTLQLHQFYFPGWQARIDSDVVQAQPTGPLGLAGVTVPAGAHEIVFTFGDTPSRRVGRYLTLAGLLLLLAGAILLRKWRWLAVVAVVIAFVGALAVGQRRAHPTDYAPAPMAVNYEDEVQLVGYRVPSHTIRAEDEVAVTLNWQALRQPGKDYTVFLHLTDTSGQLYAQHDGEPGHWFSPTTRWQTGEFVEDRHVLEWRREPPPGRYLLFAGMYDAATQVRLRTFGPDGAPIGDSVLLGEIEVVP